MQSTIQEFSEIEESILRVLELSQSLMKGEEKVCEYLAECKAIQTRLHKKLEEISNK